MTTEKELLDLCKYAVDAAKAAGATDVEAHAQAESNLESEIELAEIAIVNQSVSTGIAIRVFMGKKMGCAFTNIATKDALDEAVELAVNAAKATTEDPDFVSLSTPGSYPDLDSHWSEDVVKRDPGEVVAATGGLIEKASAAEEGLMVIGGGSAAAWQVSAYANSNGVSHSERGTASWIVGVAVAQIEGGMTPMTYAYDIRRDLDVDVDKTVNQIARTIRLCKHTAEGKTGKHTVILHPFALSQLMQYTLMQAVRGDNVARGKSKIADKIGEQIASEIFTLVDDGANPKGLNASEADDEGVPRRRTPIIEKGVLRSFLWDTYWANKMGVKSTGNAGRDMRQGLLEIRPTNLVVEPGKREIDDIISEIDHGYYIENVQGAHSSNPESGDFSIVGNPAFLVEKGELVGAVHGLMISGNIFDVLKNVVEVAKTPIILTNWIAPEIVAKDVDVIARE
jgi:PmbA protein